MDRILTRFGNGIFFCLVFTYRSRWPMVILGFFMMAGCALRPEPRDLATYLNRDVYAIAELEKSALQRYKGHTGENYTSDRDLRVSLEREIIPTYKRFEELIRRITPRTQRVRELHALYRRAAALRLRGFQTILLAIDSQDPDLVRQANDMLMQGQSLVGQWRRRLSSLAEEDGLESAPMLQKPEDARSGVAKGSQ